MDYLRQFNTNQSDVKKILDRLDRDPSTRIDYLLHNLYRHYLQCYEKQEYFRRAPQIEPLERALLERRGDLPRNTIQIVQACAAGDDNRLRACELAIQCPVCGHASNLNFNLKNTQQEHTCPNCERKFTVQYVKIEGFSDKLVNKVPGYSLACTNSAGLPVTLWLPSDDSEQQPIALNNGNYMAYLSTQDAKIPASVIMEPYTINKGKRASGYKVYSFMESLQSLGTTRSVDGWSSNLDVIFAFVVVTMFAVLLAVGVLSSPFK